MTEKAFEEIVTIKARRIMESEDGRTYAQQLLDELEISSQGGAFLAGALDAMIFDIALALDYKELQSWEYRKKFVKELWDTERPPW